MFKIGLSEKLIKRLYHDEIIVRAIMFSTVSNVIITAKFMMGH